MTILKGDINANQGMGRSSSHRDRFCLGVAAGAR
jgi:hypothetical protein